MISIFFVIPSLDGGGAERMFLNILNGMDRKVFQPSLVLVKRRGTFFDQLSPDVDTIELGCKSHLTLIPKLARLIRRRRPDVVLSTHGHLNLLIMLGRFLMRGRTSFVGRESCVVSLHNRSMGNSRIMNMLYRQLYPRFDAIICQSRDMREDLDLRFNLPPEKLRLINNGVNQERLNSLAGQGGGPDRLAPGKRNLVAAGRLDRQKGFDLLIEALALTRTPGLNLTILGAGPEEGPLKEQVRSCGLESRIRFAGFQRNPYPFLRQADLFVLSSRYEGFPNVLVEALCLGTPSVAFECPGGVNEIIRPGVNGFMAGQGDPKAMAEAIDLALAKPFDRKVVARDAGERFDLSRIIKDYERVIVSVLPN